MSSDQLLLQSKFHPSGTVVVAVVVAVVVTVAVTDAVVVAAVAVNALP